MNNNILKILLTISFSIPIVLFIFLTVSNQVLGFDSWYWLKFSHFPIYLFNILPIFLYISIIFAFKIYMKSMKIKIKPENWILLVIFLSNIFIIRFLEVEFDDFLLYAFLIPLIAYKPKIFIWLSIPIYLFYSYMHNLLFVYIYSDIIEISISPLFCLMSSIPSIFLMIFNRKWIYLGLFAILIVISPYPKMVSIYPIFFLPIYLTMIKEKIIYPDFLMILLILTSILIFSMAFNQISNNIDAFNRLCNQYDKICYNYDIKDYGFGHYFAYLGYKNLAKIGGFGVCSCWGKSCLDFKGC